MNTAFFHPCNILKCLIYAALWIICYEMSSKCQGLLWVYNQTLFTFFFEDVCVEKPLKYCLKLVDHVLVLIQVHQVADRWYTPECSNPNDAWHYIISGPSPSLSPSINPPPVLAPPQGHLREGKCHLSLGNAMAASRCFQKVLELEPGNMQAQQEVRVCPSNTRFTVVHRPLSSPTVVHHPILANAAGSWRELLTFVYTTFLHSTLQPLH